MDLTIIILYQLEPSPLSHIQRFLSEDVLQTLVVSKYLATYPIKVMAPYLQSKDYGSHFQVMSRVVLLVLLQLPRSVGDHLPVLHQNRAKSHLGRVTINSHRLTISRDDQDRSASQSALDLLEALFAFQSPFELFLLPCESRERGR